MIRVCTILLLLPLLPNAVWGQEDADTQNPFWQNEYCINPSVPYSARLDPREGTASLLFDITAAGKPNNIRVVNVTAVDGDKKLADAFGRDAKKTLGRWQYFAYIKNSQEAPRFDVPITFHFVAKDSTEKSIFSTKKCTTSVLPEPPSHAGNPHDPMVNIAQCQAPSMPKKENKENVSGQVTLTFDVSAKGRLENIELASGEAENNFSKAAMSALRNWRYRPFLKAGQPIERNTLSVDFEFGDITDGAEKLSCTQAPFGETFNLTTVKESETCRIFFTYENIPRPSKGCFKD